MTDTGMNLRRRSTIYTLQYGHRAELRKVLLAYIIKVPRHFLQAFCINIDQLTSAVLRLDQVLEARNERQVNSTDFSFSINLT
jgi:hypothetical protein